MPVFHDDVLDAGLDLVDDCTECEVRTAGSSVLVDAIVLDAGNYGSPINNSGAGLGRKMQCLVSSANDMLAISVSSAGDAAKVVLIKSIASTPTDYCVADVSPPVTLGASDQINLGTFSAIFKDPT